MTAGPFSESITAARGVPAAETHNIVLSAASKVVSTSDGLGWDNIYATLTSERQWAGTLAPIDHFCFAYCLRHSARIQRRIAGEQSVRELGLRPRQIGILPTRVASTFRMTGTADIMMVYLRGSLVEETAREMYDVSGAAVNLEPSVGFCDPLLEQVALEIVAALDRRDVAGDQRYIDQLASTATSHLLRIRGEWRKSQRKSDDSLLRSRPDLGSAVARMRAYIVSNLESDLSLARLARVASLSQASSAQAFAKAQGETLHQFIIKRRIERAQTLLISTNLSIAEIALQTGFSSQSHLSDVFRRVIGETPNGYRSAAKLAATSSTCRLQAPHVHPNTPVQPVESSSRR